MIQGWKLEEIHREAAKVDQMEGAIVELRRKKELEDANYRYYSASLELRRALVGQWFYFFKQGLFSWPSGRCHRGFQRLIQQQQFR